MYRPNAISLTGATGQLGCALLRHLAVALPDVHLRLLVREDSPTFETVQFQRLLARFHRGVDVIFGDLRDLCLSRRDQDLLASSDGGLWHLAANISLRVTPSRAAELAEAVNIEGTRQVLALCARRTDCRLFYVSTAFVAGRHTGIVYEDQLDPEKAFHNGYERSKAAAEQLVRRAAAEGLAVTIFRPSLVIEDTHRSSSRSLPRLFAAAVKDAHRRGETTLPLPMPEAVSINMVPERFVIKAMLLLAARGSVGRTYHLTAQRPTPLKKIGAILERMYPEIRFVHNQPSSTLIGRMLQDLSGYWEEDLFFDRANLDQDLAEAIDDEVDWPAVIERELGSLARRNYSRVR